MPETGDWLFPNATRAAQDEEQSSLLDVLDNVLNRGAVLTGDIVLGVADVDLDLRKAVCAAGCARQSHQARPGLQGHRGPATQTLEKTPRRAGVTARQEDLGPT